MGTQVYMVPEYKNGEPSTKTATNLADSNRTPPSCGDSIGMTALCTPSQAARNATMFAGRHQKTIAEAYILESRHNRFSTAFSSRGRHLRKTQSLAGTRDKHAGGQTIPTRARQLKSEVRSMAGTMNRTSISDQSQAAQGGNPTHGRHHRIGKRGSRPPCHVVRSLKVIVVL